MPPSPDILISAALGSLHEPAGIVAVERIEQLGEFDSERQRWRIEANYRVLGIAGLDRAGPADVADQVAAYFPEGVPSNPGRRSLLVDTTAAGRGVLGLLRARKLRPVPIILSDAPGYRATGQGAQLARADIVSGLAIVLGERRLRVEPGLPGGDQLAAQLTRISHSQ